MSTSSGDDSSRSSGVFLPSAFTVMVGAAALFIAACSAFFSVSGLGLLFIGSAGAVMVMAASLEAGKLVAASFLYRHWRSITPALRFYLTLAVLVLIAITSLGNYGYLARAYEKTNSSIALLEDQVRVVQREMDDAQAQIDASRSQAGSLTDAARRDVEHARARIAQAGQSLDQSQLRTDAQRKSLREKRDRDVELLKQRLAEVAGVLKQGVDSGEAAVAALGERLAVLDRAVDAYTREGGAGFLKSDSIQRGQVLRQEQEPQRKAIADEIAEHRRKQEQLRSEHARAVEAIGREMSAVEQQLKLDVAKVDAEEQALRKTRNDTVASAEKEIAAIQAQGQSVRTQSGSQVEALYQRIRTGNEEMQRLREQIAATDIGSYRFVARVFSAPADDVVKWLIMLLVLVFDPLAVALTVGFNVALMRDARRRAAPPQPASASATDAPATITEGLSAILPRPRRWATVTVGCVVLALVAGGVYLAAAALGGRSVAAHASAIPADSFAVLTIRPAELCRSSGQSLTDLFASLAGQRAAAELAEALTSGIDPNANVYAFAKYPGGRATEGADRPVMLLGIVARVSNPTATEASLSKFVQALGSSLAGDRAGELTRARSMVKFGRGRYLDPAGGFLTYAVTDTEAIVMVEVEGDPAKPTVENEIRLCLATPEQSKTVASRSEHKLPQRATSSSGPISLWFDAARCFSQMPKNPMAQARYQKLQRHLGFDMLLSVTPSGDGRVQMQADYAYSGERFRDGPEPAPVELLSKLGPVDQAGIPGRLMDRCVATLDFDSLIGQLKMTLSGSRENASTQVLVEKSIASNRSGRFVLTAQYDDKAGPALVAALRSIVQ